jgi:hypothetical protein
MYNEKTIDALTGEETLRAFTAEEIAEVEKNREAAQKEFQAIQAKEQARKKVLESLGLAEEQIQALIG